MEQTRATIREFLLRYIRNNELADDDDIFIKGFVNSLFAMQLVAFVEQSFGITIEDEDLELDNFRSIAAIAAFISRKTTASAPV